jgi:hypothetical protein
MSKLQWPAISNLERRTDTLAVYKTQRIQPKSNRIGADMAE